ncbi:MAG: acyl-CoA dehydrogenase family protein [Candidatus Baltobacteraceae bacterium]
MFDAPTFDWPFFEETHRTLARELWGWAGAHAAALVDETDVDASCRRIVKALGDAGWLGYCVPSERFVTLDARALCVIRETLAYHEPLADFAFAMQGLGSGPLSLAGTREQQTRYLPRVRNGSAIAAFALTESEAGSDVASLATTAQRDGDGWILEGEKTWISNGGIADFTVVFARTGEAPGSRGISAFVVDAGTKGFSVPERLVTIAPHPLGTLRFAACRVPAESLVGEPGGGFKLAMRTLDIFRTSVAAAALGMARRALAAALERVDERRLFGAPLADLQLTQAALAEMATATDASALLTYRAAWLRDRGERATREAAMAKRFATESAQRTIDRAVQLFGALGVARGNVAERLYREIRSLRIYEGASEVQQLIVARETLARVRNQREGHDQR